MVFFFELNIGCPRDETFIDWILSSITLLLAYSAKKKKKNFSYSFASHPLLQSYFLYYLAAGKGCSSDGVFTELI